MGLPTVLVTEQDFRRAEVTFRAASGLQCVPAPPDEADLARAIRESDANRVIIGSRRYRDELYASLPRGAVLARFGVGYDGIDLAKATAAGVLCTNTPDVLTQSVAEHTMLLVAAAARELPGLDARTRTGVWRPQAGIELAGKTLAIIGCGRIGRAVAHIASAGFGMTVIGYRRSTSPEILADFDRVTGDFAQAVANADFISLHMPGSAANAHFIDATRLAQMVPHAWLINTARGSLIDEPALGAALASGRLAGAALDVFEQEPYQPASGGVDLRTLPNVILTPHVGSNTADANRRMAERALRNIERANAKDFAGMDLLNPEVLRNE